MAKFGVWKDAFFKVGTTDLSSHLREIEINTSLKELAANTHGSNTLISLAGLRDWTLIAKFLQDFSTGEIDDTFEELYRAGGDPVSLFLRADSGIVSTSNPLYTGLGILINYVPMSSPHGSNLASTITFRAAGPLTRYMTFLSNRERPVPLSTAYGRVRPVTLSGRNSPVIPA
jgi:hypothetical protein